VAKALLGFCGVSPAKPSPNGLKDQNSALILCVNFALQTIHFIFIDQKIRDYLPLSRIFRLSQIGNLVHAVASTDVVLRKEI
jgi:hypothetical protein